MDLSGLDLIQTPFGLGLEGNANEAFIQVDVIAARVRPDGPASVKGDVTFFDDPEHTSEPVDQIVIGLVPANRINHAATHTLELAIFFRLEWRRVRLGRVKNNTGRSGAEAGWLATDKDRVRLARAIGNAQSY